MTSSNVTKAETVEPSETAPSKSVDDRLIDELVDGAQAEGLQLTKRLLEPALEGEITDHLGYDKHDPAGKNSRNGTRAKTVLTDVGPVEITVPRDREGSFEPKIVKKRQKRLSGVDEMVISLAAKDLTTGEVQAHLAEVYGADVSRQTISTITDKVLEGMAEWQNRPAGQELRATRASHGCQLWGRWPIRSTTPSSSRFLISKYQPSCSHPPLTRLRPLPFVRSPR
ncbi:hypothetical protein ABID94_003506 [Streptomyces sp. PvR018]